MLLIQIHSRISLKLVRYGKNWAKFNWFFNRNFSVRYCYILYNKKHWIKNLVIIFYHYQQFIQEENETISFYQIALFSILNALFAVFLFMYFCIFLRIGHILPDKHLIVGFHLLLNIFEFTFCFLFIFIYVFLNSTQHFSNQIILSIQSMLYVRVICEK